MASNEEMMRATAIVVKPGLNRSDLLAAYDTWERSKLPYDEVMSQRGYNGPRVTAQGLAIVYQEEQRHAVKVLDVGAGTGLVGDELRELGFVDMDAIEPSDALVDTATAKDVYQHIHKLFLTGEPLHIPTGSYDAVVSCGAFIENHIPPEGLDEIVRLTKPGGHVVITTRQKYLDTVEMFRGKLEPYMQRLEQTGTWKMLSREEFQHYYNVDTGLMWIFQVLKH